jgi:hypothetical protein
MLSSLGKERVKRAENLFIGTLVELASDLDDPS